VHDPHVFPTRSTSSAASLPNGARPLLATLLAVGVLATGCRDDASTKPPATDAPAPRAAVRPVEDARTRAAPEGTSPTSPAGVVPELPAVTPERIDAFLAYQGRRLQLEQALWADLAAEATPRAPGRTRARGRTPEGGQSPTAASLRRLEQRAEEEAEALEAAGLTPAELESLGTLVREVLGPRQLALELGLEETVNLLEEQAERLEGAQQQDLLDQVVPLRERLTSLRSLAEVRATHGDSAVDAVLSREEALLAWQEARVTTVLNDRAESGEGQAGGRR